MYEMTDADIWRNLLLSLRWTIALSFASLILGALFGLLLIPARLSKNPIISGLCRGYIELFQGTPLLIQLFVIYFGLPLIGIVPSAWVAAVFGMSLWAAAFLCEIWRGAVQAIPRGQWEGSASLGMSYLEQLRHVILPQALRLSVPPTVGFMVQIVKSTSVTSIIGFVELARAGAMMSNVTFQPFYIYSIVALFYFLICWPLSRISRRLERKPHGLH